MGFFTSNWPEIASALLALLALYVSIRVGQENRKFKAPSFRIESEGLTPHGANTLRLTNNGETSARNVKLTFAMDPTNMFTTTPLEWAVLDKNESVTITFDSPSTSYDRIMHSSWLTSVLPDHQERRKATIEYTNRLGKRASEEVLIPNEQAIEQSLARP